MLKQVQHDIWRHLLFIPPFWKSQFNTYFGNSCAFCQTHPYGYCALHCLLYVFGAARHMRRRWTVAISTLILHFPIICSFVFMSNLMAHSSMSNIFTPFNPIFLTPLKVKYKGEATKNAMNPQFHVSNWGNKIF